MTANNRDIKAAAEFLADATDEKLQLSARHDPDMIRDVARWAKGLSGVLAGAKDAAAESTAT